MKKNAILYIVVILTLFSVIITALVLLLPPKQDSHESHGKTVADMLENDAPTITYQGKNYQRKDHIKSYLFLGIDREGSVEPTDNLFAGQSDTMIVLVVDEDAQCYTPLLLDRDTITSVDILDHNGEIAYSAPMQICLAHAYGTGGEDSCENAVRAVSHLLYDTPIDAYASLHMDAIPVLNDTLGGVTVTLQDDFSQSDPSMQAGKTITLNGEQAYLFLRGRMSVGDGNNTGRMRRQQTYLESAVSLFREKISVSKGFTATLYQALQPYSVSSLSGSDINALAKLLTQYRSTGFLTIDGEHRVEDGFMAFHADEDSLRQSVLSLFYAEVIDE